VFDSYISSTGQCAASNVYANVWESKAYLARILERRQQAKRLAGATSKDIQKKWDDLIDKRRTLSFLLLNAGKDAKFRDEQLRALTDAIEKLEQELATLVPALERNRDLARRGPDDLARALPAQSAFIEFVLYQRTGGAYHGERSYLAFVVLPNNEVNRIELKEASAIHKALTAWRVGIESRRDTPEQARRLA